MPDGELVLLSRITLDDDVRDEERSEGLEAEVEEEEEASKDAWLR